MQTPERGRRGIGDPNDGTEDPSSRYPTLTRSEPVPNFQSPGLSFLLHKEQGSPFSYLLTLLSFGHLLLIGAFIQSVSQLHLPGPSAWIDGAQKESDSPQKLGGGFLLLRIAWAHKGPAGTDG
jgi:hypothetical protein